MIINRVTLLGQKDHGKSTLIGNLLIQTGSVSEQRIREAKKTSKSLGRNFEPGYILDSFEEERVNEMTIDTTRAQVKYKNSGFEFIDVPGHEELMKNMLSGASYADFALLLVSAKPDEGITDQTKRHLFVAKMMGINKLVVAVNKLDSVGYDKKRFDEIEVDIRSYLDKIGFGKNEVNFVPISAYDAENLVKQSKKIKWYKGKNLMETLVSMSNLEKDDKNKGLMISLQGLFEGDESTVFGKILSGKVKKGEKITILPSGKEARILEIFVSGGKKSSATRGNVVTLKLDRKVGREIKGSVASNNKSACRTGNVVHALVLTTKKMQGSSSIRINGVEVGCKRFLVKKAIDVATGESVVSKTIKPLSAGSVEIELERKVASDNFESTPEIGRFVLYTNKSFAGIGIITD
jgi:bifunctional enzyme CysN/CysC/sulfate adenylyltransferase subunit 1